MDDKHPYRDAVAANLRAEKGRQRQTNARLAKKTGLPPKTVARRISGETGIDIEDLALLAKALGKDPADFLPPNTGDEQAAGRQPALSA